MLPWYNIWNHFHQELQEVTSNWGATVREQKHHQFYHFQLEIPAPHHWPWWDQPCPIYWEFAYVLPLVRATKVTGGLDHKREGTQHPWQLPLPSDVLIYMAPQSNLSIHNEILLPEKSCFIIQLLFGGKLIKIELSKTMQILICVII